MFRSLLALMCLTTAVHAAPLDNRFTYQGRLEDNGSPANGLFDLEFRLHDALSGGAQVGAPLALNDIPVEDGVFSVELNFGAFTSEARWLAIAVRDGASAGAYEALSPRQAITAAPVAQFALSGNPGPQGPQGPSGVVQVISVAGSIPAVISPGFATPPWTWVGPDGGSFGTGGFATVTVSAGQRVTGSGVAVFAHNSTSSVAVSMSLCYSNNSAGAEILPFHPMNFPDATVLPQPTKTALAAAGTRVFPSAGTFRVGYCVRNKSTTINLGNNDFVNVWFMVTN